MKKGEHIRLEIDGDLLKVYIGNLHYNCCVHNNAFGYFFEMGEVDNGFLFEVADIRDKYLFQREILGYSTEDGRFPYCHTREDVIKLAKAVVDYNNGQFKGNGVLSLKKRKNIKFNFNL